MQSFESLSLTWLQAVTSKEPNLPIQMVEVTSADGFATDMSHAAAAKNLQVFHIDFHATMLDDPLLFYRQILHWFAEQKGSNYVDGIIDKYCYALHRDIFKAWYKREFYYRLEPLIYDEAGYEKKEFFNSLKRLLDVLSQSHAFVGLIGHVENAPDHLLATLVQFMETGAGLACWGIMGIVPQTRHDRQAKNKPIWQECLRLLERQGLILPYNDTLHTSQSFNWVRPVSIQTYDEQYAMIVCAGDMFAYQDVIDMVESVRRQYNNQHNGFMLFLSAYSSLMLGDLETAIRDFGKVQNRLQSTDNEGILVASYFWLSICYTLKTQDRLARAAQEQCEKLALEYDNRRWYILSQFANFYINSSISQQNLTQPLLLGMRTLLAEVGFDNILALVQTQVFGFSEQFDKKTTRSYLKNCVLALRTARKNRNQLGMSMALHSMGVVNMRLGNFRQTYRLYQLSIDIRERYQGDADLVPMLNGLGYFLVGQEEWKKAWAIFDRALTLLIDHRNFNEVSVTLYNFVWLYTQSGNVILALEVMNDLIELMYTRNVESVPFRNLKDLFVLKGWLHILLRQPIQARYCLQRVAKLTHLHETSHSRVLRLILNARVAMAEHEPSIAIRNTHTAQALCEQAADLDLFMTTSLKLEIAKLFNEIGLSSEAQPIFAQMRQKAHDQKLDALSQHISRAMLGMHSLTEITLPAIQKPYRILLDIAEKDRRIVDMQQQLTDIYQANSIVEMSIQEPDLMQFLTKVIGVLDRRVPATQFALLVITQDDVSSIESVKASNDVDDETLIRWDRRLKQRPATEQKFVDDDAKVAAWPLQMESVDSAWLAISGDEEQSSVWNHAFLQLAAQQIGLVLDRRLRELYLERRNKTDILTGVLNRAGLYERMQKQFAQMQRQTEQSLALCYFDLDHFKYFNDRFGHELGDHVLKALVHTVQSQLRGSDELGRLGGDEFIILIPDSTKEETASMIERLRIRIATPDWWMPLFAENGNEHIKNPVPEKDRISASFGVVMVPQWPDEGVNQIDLLAQGDEAMYLAKKAGKNCVKITQYKS